MNSLIGLLISVAYIGIVLLIAIKLEHLPREFSRTFVHIMVSNWWIIATYFIQDFYLAMSIPLFFIFFNGLNIKYNWIPCINSKLRYGNMGTVYYALAIALLTWLTFSNKELQVIGGVGILAMGYGDGFAAILGQHYGKHEYTIFKGTKSLEGSIAMFIMTFGVLILYFYYVSTYPGLLVIVSLAFVATLVEAISPFGLDNIFVPMITSLLYFILLM